jgi:hypothetical protein
MNIFRLYISLLSTLISLSSSFAQNVTDAVRWSYTNPGGTGRTLGVGGAFGAMGGDFSVININPAGLGTYRMSEFTFSPSLTIGKTNSFITTDPSYLTSDKENKLSVDNVGAVFHSGKIGSIALGISKISDLNKNFEYSGKTGGSITHRFIERANGHTLQELDDFEAYPAYYVGAIYDINGDLNYESDVSLIDEVRKSQIVDQEGYINEFSIGWGKSFNSKYQLGLSLGIPFVSFEEVKQYTEDDPTEIIPVFTKLDYNEYLNTSGAGVNIKAGFIVSPVKFFRIGGAIHSPTWYTLNDDYSTQINYAYELEKVNFYDTISPDGSFKYSLNTPAKLIGSIGTLFDAGKIKGFINGDIEWIDYNNNAFDFTTYSNDPSEKQYTTEINNEIEKYLGSVINYRIGGELAYGNVRFRAGYETGDSPLSNDSDKINTLSFGLGIRFDKFFLDFGIRNRKYTEGYVPYVLIDSSKETLVNNEINQTKAVLTAGFKF